MLVVTLVTPALAQTPQVVAGDQLVATAGGDAWTLPHGTAGATFVCRYHEGDRGTVDLVGLKGWIKVTFGSGTDCSGKVGWVLSEDFKLAPVLSFKIGLPVIYKGAGFEVRQAITAVSAGDAWDRARIDPPSQDAAVFVCRYHVKDTGVIAAIGTKGWIEINFSSGSECSGKQAWVLGEDFN